jgi:hypothetical protein
MRVRVEWVGVLAVAAGSACAGASQEVAPTTAAPAPTTCARRLDAATTPKPIGLPRASSTVALAQLGDKTLAYVADEDDQALRIVDVDGKEIASMPLDGRPSQLMFAADGRLLVAIRDKAEIEVLEPTAQADTVEKRCVTATDAEPVAMAMSPDDTKLYVSTGWGRSLGGYDAKSADMARAFTVALPREPRGVVVSNDGARAFVSHAVGGDVSVIDLDVKRILSVPTHPNEELITRLRKKALAAKATFSTPSFSRGLTGTSCQGFALAKLETGGGRIFAPQVLVDPGDPNSRPTGYGSPRNDQAEVGDVAVIDGSSGDVLLPSLEAASESFMRAVHGGGEHSHGDECLLPRAAAFDKESGMLLVTCLGIDDVVAYDGLAASPVRAEKRRWDTAAGPTGIAIDGPRRRAIVWAQFEHVLNRIPLGGSDLVDEKSEKVEKVGRIDLPLKTPLPLAFELGRVLFHAVGDPRVSHDGRACASCHPDGRDDALTWATPNGPRRSINLAGRVGNTAPFSWSGTEDTLKDHMTITFDRLKGEGGLKSMELEALAQYVLSMTPPPAPKVTGPKVDRGDEIFHSKATGCATCHAGEHMTDNSHHDVQSKNPFDRGGEFNTPSLRFVGNGGPYFHDGRYKTLRQLLTDADRKMGYTKHLNDEDLEALEAYLRSL